MISQERIETNQLLMEMVGLDLTSKSLHDDIQASKYYTLLSEHIESQIQSAINWIDSDSAKEFFFNDAYHQAEIWDSLEEDWDTILHGEYDTIDDLLAEVYDYGKSRGYSDMAETLRYTPTDRLAFAFARNYNYGLIQNLDNDLRGAIKQRMTQAAIQGENPYSLAPHLVKLGVTPLPGSTFTPHQRAVLIARTETSRIQNTGILQSYVNEGYTQVKLLTAEDDHVCTICLRYAYEFNNNDKIIFENRGDERVHDIKSLIKGGSYPPFHPQCRCTYLSVWEGKEEYPEKPFMVNLTPLESWEETWTPYTLNNNYNIYLPREKIGTSNESDYVIKVKEITDQEEFLDTLKIAANSQPPTDRWRVEVPRDISYFNDCRLFITEHGSVAAIRENGDIISVCAYLPPGANKAPDKTSTLLKFTTTQGGNRLDSYDGNYGVYRHCGFEPVSYCEFDVEYAPEGWKYGYAKNPHEFNEEKVIFFKYTGKESKYIDENAFYANVNVSIDYDAAKRKRDLEMK